MFTKGALLRWSGAESGELARVLRCLGALFFLFLSYYLVKPLRNSQFLKEFAPHALPWIYLLVSILSLALTFAYQQLARRVSRPVLVAATFLWAVLCKVVFWAALPGGGQLWTGIFYLWASIYFLLLASTLWGCFNERFTPAQAERCFAFIAMGATLGNIGGSLLAQWLSSLHWTYGTLLASALALLISLGLLWPELGYAPSSVEPDRRPAGPAGDWIGNRFLRAIGVMVLALAVYTTASDLMAQRSLDRQVGKEVFAQRLPEFSGWEQGPAEFSALRQLNSSRRQLRLRELAQQRNLPVARLQRDYQTYQDATELRLRRIFASTFWAQGLLGVMVLAFACRPFLRRYGVERALTVLPGFALLSLPLFLLPLGVNAVQLLLVVGGTLNYSFNNATKEVIYTVAPAAALVQAKPFIEGPVMRLGDVFCALLALGAAGLAARLGWSDRGADLLVLIPSLIIVVVWLQVVQRAGRDYLTASERAGLEGGAAPP